MEFSTDGICHAFEVSPEDRAAIVGSCVFRDVLVAMGEFMREQAFDFVFNHQEISAVNLIQMFDVLGADADFDFTVIACFVAYGFWIIDDDESDFIEFHTGFISVCVKLAADRKALLFNQGFEVRNGLIENFRAFGAFGFIDDFDFRCFKRRPIACVGERGFNGDGVAVGRVLRVWVFVTCPDLVGCVLLQLWSGRLVTIDDDAAIGAIRGA